MKIKIINDHQKIMRQKSQEVPLPLSKVDKETLDAMLLYLKNSQDEEWAEKHHARAGVGLAAVQVGVLKRMFVIYYKNADGKEVQYQLVNPIITETTVRKTAIKAGEGCLSVDEDHPGLVHRHYKIKMEAFDALQNKKIEIIARSFDSIVLQHEYDHLDGMFYYDRINPMAPDLVLENEEII